MRAKEKTEATLLSPDETSRMRDLKDEIAEIEKEIGDAEKTKRRKQAEVEHLNRQLIQAGAQRNGTHREDIIRLNQDLLVLKAEITALESLIAETRAGELPTLTAELACLEQKERDARLLADLERKAAQITDLIEEWEQRQAIAVYAAQRMGEIVRELRSMMQSRDREHDAPAIRLLAIQIHNRAGQHCDKTKFENAAFFDTIQTHLAAGWR